MSNPLAAHPPWRQLVIVAVVLPVMIGLAVLAFAWPNARIAPRKLPVGVIATSGSEQIVAGLGKFDASGFDVRLYSDETTARAAIRDREICGAFLLTGGKVSVFEASAASSTVAQLLSNVGQQLAGSPGQAPLTLSPVDVVPSSRGDPHGLVLSSALLPLTICSVIIAAITALLIGFRPAWRQVMALTVVSAAAGLGGFLIAQSFLGALPNNHLATWAALALTMFAMSSTTAGLISLIGAPGLGLGAAIMVFLGNPFSGASSAPQLLPDWVDHLGQWLPPGAGANLLRSTAYFSNHGAASHLAVLLLWTAFGMITIVVGHHTWTGFAAHRPRTIAAHQSAAPGVYPGQRPGHSTGASLRP
jgi:hypothetical protein